MAKSFNILSFKHALTGIWTALTEQPNFKFHLIATALALFLALYFQVSGFEWLVLILTIGLVISLELTNTAIEEIVNSFTEEVHPAAKKAKDVAAGAVLIISITALIIGIYIFLPYILNLI